MEKIAIPIPEAANISGISRSRLYELIKGGALSAKKNGRYTLILMDELKAYMASLPPSGGLK